MTGRSGARARMAGHEAERAVAAWLRGHGCPDARTTRSAAQGIRQPGDILDAIPLVSIEVKAHVTPRWPEWIAQARRDARERGGPGCSWMVAWKPPGVGLDRVAEWVTVSDHAMWSYGHRLIADPGKWEPRRWIADGDVVWVWRGGQRFAVCSTFTEAVETAAG